MNRTLLAAALIAIAPLAAAQSGSMKGMAMKQEGVVHQAKGKVAKVDAAKGSVTIAHGPVESLKWPSMTMAFKVKDKAMLEKLKPGDQVEFGFVQSGSDYTITGIR